MHSQALGVWLVDPRVLVDDVHTLKLSTACMGDHKRMLRLQGECARVQALEGGVLRWVDSGFPGDHVHSSRSDTVLSAQL